MGLEQDFPVPEHGVPRVHVPAQRLAEWKEVAQDEIMRALSNRHSWYNAFKDRVREGFDLIADKPHLKAFVRPVPNTADKDILVRSTLEGVTLDDLVSGFYCETTYDVRCAFAHMYEANFLDAGVVQVHETHTEEDPMHCVGMRWVAFRSPAPAIVTSRDFLYFSYEGTAYDVDGRRVLFRFQRSMPMDGIPVEDSHLPPLVRGKISNLHLYRQNGSHVDGFTKAMHSNAGHMPSYVVTKTITFMFPGIANAETVGDARALLAVGSAKLNRRRVTQSSSMSGRGPQSLSGRYSGPSPSSASFSMGDAHTNACSVCFHKFKLTRSKRRCQGCCREVCKRCTRRLFFFDELKQISDTAVVALRFCLNCTRQARAEIRETKAAAASLRSSLHRRRSSESATSSTTGRTFASPNQLHKQQQQQLVRRIPSASRLEPESEPYADDMSIASCDLDDDSDDDSVSYNGFNANALLTQSAANYHLQNTSMAPAAQPLQPHQLEQLQQLQQQRQFSQQDHDEFVRLYGQFATSQSVDSLANRGSPAPYCPPPPAAPSPQLMQQQVPRVPRPFRRQNSESRGVGVGWSHSGNVTPLSQSQRQHQQQHTAMHTMPEMLPRHMIPPMPQPDRKSNARARDIMPLENMIRHQSAPNLHHYDSSQSMRAPPPPPPHSVSSSSRRLAGGRAPLSRAVTANATSSAASSSSSSQDTLASEDLEMIFKLRMMLFNGDGNADSEAKGDTDTLLTTSSSSSAKRNPLLAGGDASTTY